MVLARRGLCDVILIKSEFVLKLEKVRGTVRSTRRPQLDLGLDGKYECSRRRYFLGFGCLQLKHVDWLMGDRRRYQYHDIIDKQSS